MSFFKTKTAEITGYTVLILKVELTVNAPEINNLFVLQEAMLGYDKQLVHITVIIRSKNIFNSLERKVELTVNAPEINLNEYQNTKKKITTFSFNLSKIPKTTIQQQYMCYWTYPSVSVNLSVKTFYYPTII
jgi:hypothetical protein